MDKKGGVCEAYRQDGDGGWCNVYGCHLPSHSYIQVGGGNMVIVIRLCLPHSRVLRRELESSNRGR